MGQEFGGEWIHICVWLNPFAVTWNYHNIVNQLNPNIKLKKKKTCLPSPDCPQCFPSAALQGMACPAPPQETMDNKLPFQWHSLPDPYYTWIITNAAFWNSAHGRWLGVMKDAVLFGWSGKASLKKRLLSRNLNAGKKRNVWWKENTLLPD